MMHPWLCSYRDPRRLASCLNISSFRIAASLRRWNEAQQLPRERFSPLAGSRGSECSPKADDQTIDKLRISAKGCCAAPASKGRRRAKSIGNRAGGRLVELSIESYVSTCEGERNDVLHSFGCVAALRVNLHRG